MYFSITINNISKSPLTYPCLKQALDNYYILYCFIVRMAYWILFLLMLIGPILPGWKLLTLLCIFQASQSICHVFLSMYYFFISNLLVLILYKAKIDGRWKRKWQALLEQWTNIFLYKYPDQFRSLIFLVSD